MKHQLFIDTTNKYCYVGLYNGEKIIDFVKLEVNKNVTDVIVPSIDNLLNKNAIDKMNINKLYVDIGPGSFTGVRVGIIIAKAWLAVYDVEIFYLDSLTIQMPQLNGISIIYAKSQKYYLTIYENNTIVQEPIIILENQIQEYKNHYSKLNVFVDNNDQMYDNFLLHKSQFKKLRQDKKLKALYLKEPI